MADDQNGQDRQARLDELYLRNYSSLVDLALADRRLLVEDADRIAQSVARHLPLYSGELTDQSFEAWAEEIVRPAVVCLAQFYTVKRQCERYVNEALWRGLGHRVRPNFYDDYSEVVQELKQEVWIWVLENLDNLLKPDQSAAITTRVFARAKLIALAWQKKHKVRRNAVIRDLYGILAEDHDQQEQERLEQEGKPQVDDKGQDEDSADDFEQHQPATEADGEQDTHCDDVLDVEAIMLSAIDRYDEPDDNPEDCAIS